MGRFMRSSLSLAKAKKASRAEAAGVVGKSERE